MASVAAQLVSDLKSTGYANSGIVGIRYLFEALSNHGQIEAAMQLLLSTEYPSYGYMITNEHEPATTIWELWQSDTAPPSMNSRNHIMFGTVDTFLYKSLGGLRVAPDALGFSKLIIRPEAALLKTSSGSPLIPGAKVSAITPRGLASASWSVVDHLTTV